MAELKTKQTEANVEDFINSFADTEQKKKDSFELLKLMKFSAENPRLRKAAKR